MLLVAAVLPAAAARAQMTFSFSPSDGSQLSSSSTTVTIIICSPIHFSDSDASINGVSIGSFSTVGTGCSGFGRKYTQSTTLNGGANTLAANACDFNSNCYSAGATIYYNALQVSATTSSPIYLTSGQAGSAGFSVTNSATAAAQVTVTPSCSGIAINCSPSPYSTTISANSSTSVTATFGTSGAGSGSVTVCAAYSGSPSTSKCASVTVNATSPAASSLTISPHAVSLVVGQGGPGGVPNPSLWLRADTLVTVANGAVTAVGDASGRGHNTTSPVNHQPTLVTNGMNGRPTLRFSQSTWLDAPSLSSSALPIPFSIFYVVQRSSAQVAASSWMWQRVFSGWDGNAADADWTPSPPNYAAGLTDANGNPNVVSPSAIALVDSRPSFVFQGVRIGDHAEVANGTQQSLTGDISELILYDRALSSAEQDRVVGYLRRKWGITSDSTQLTATIRDQSGTVMPGELANWTSRNANIVGVGPAQGTGTTITPVAAGSTYIIGTAVNAASVKDSAAITVTMPSATPLSLSISLSPRDLVIGQNGTAQATVLDQFGGVMSSDPVTWSSSAPGIASVSGTGTSVTITGVSNGSAVITARASNGVANTLNVIVGPNIQVQTQGLNARTSISRDQCLTIAAGDAAAYECGDLRLVHGLPATRTMNKSRAPTLIFNSRHARPGALVAADIVLNTWAPATLTATLQISGQSASTRTYSWSPSCSAQHCRIVVPVDAGVAQGLASGIYPYTLSVATNGGLTSNTVTDTLVIINRVNSPFGRGWWLDGLEEIKSISADKWLWVGGDGSTRLYKQTGVGSLLYLAEQLTHVDSLVRVDTAGTTVWRRKLQNGAFVEFNSAGKHVRTVNRQQHVTSFEYVGGSLLRYVRLPSPAADTTTRPTYQFAYDTNTSGFPVLRSVTSPTIAGQSRIVNIARSGLAWITSITDPDGSVVRFNDGSSTGLIAWRRNRLTDTTFFAYDSGYAVKQVTIDMRRTGGTSIVSTLTAAETRSIASLNDSPQLPANATSVIDGPRTDVNDITTFFIDRFGGPDTVVNALGETTRIERGDANFPQLATAVTSPTGFRTIAGYTSRGLLDHFTAVNPYGDGRDAITTYTWDTKWNSPTMIVGPEADTTSMTYDTATGNLLSATQGGDTTRFRFFSTQLLQNVRSGVVPDTSLDSYTYDALGNLAQHSRPNGFRKAFVNDAIGRVIADTSFRESPKAPIKHQVTYDITGRDSTELTFAEADSLRVTTLYDAEDHALSVEQRAMPARAPTTHGTTIGTVTRSYTYDAAGRQLTESSSDQSITRSFDLAGNVVRDTRLYGGDSVAYDALNRVIARVGSLDSARYAYDASGMRSANNPFAKISRSYYPNGAMKGDTSWIANSPMSAFDGPYGTLATYDRAGRRTQLQWPSVFGGSVQYTYDRRTGQLATVTDKNGIQFRHHYDARGRLDSLIRRDGLSDKIAESRTYDVESNIGHRVVSGYVDNTYGYDALGRVVQAGGDSAYYDGLGHATRSKRNIVTESVDYDAFGNRLSMFSQSRLGTQNITYQYSDASTQLVKELKEQNASDFVDTTFKNYDGLGNLMTSESHHWFAFGAVGLTGNTDSGYVRDLRANEGNTRLMSSGRTRDTVWLVTSSSPSAPAYQTLETYRYDALGRRIWRRMVYGATCGQVELSSGCMSTITTTVWDGSQMLVENRVAADTGYNPTARGLVGYVHGLGTDRPIEVLKSGAHDLIPITSWADDIVDGACPSSRCNSSDVFFPMSVNGMYGARYDAVQTANYYGSLVEGQDGSGYVYQRNRYLDPSTGTFTQPDPIGLAGGLNVYGFAQGDPINYSDPLGQWPGLKEIKEKIKKKWNDLGRGTWKLGAKILLVIKAGLPHTDPEPVDADKQPPPIEAPAPPTTGIDTSSTKKGKDPNANLYLSPTFWTTIVPLLIYERFEWPSITLPQPQPPSGSFPGPMPTPRCMPLPNGGCLPTPE